MSRPPDLLSDFPSDLSWDFPASDANSVPISVHLDPQSSGLEENPFLGADDWDWGMSALSPTNQQNLQFGDLSSLLGAHEDFISELDKLVPKLVDHDVALLKSQVRDFLGNAPVPHPPFSPSGLLDMSLVGANPAAAIVDAAAAGPVAPVAPALAGPAQFAAAPAAPAAVDDSTNTNLEEPPEKIDLGERTVFVPLSLLRTKMPEFKRLFRMRYAPNDKELEVAKEAHRRIQKRDSARRKNKRTHVLQESLTNTRISQVKSTMYILEQVIRDSPHVRRAVKEALLQAIEARLTHEFAD